MYRNNADLQGAKILLVDDQPANLDVLWPAREGRGMKAIDLVPRKA